MILAEQYLLESLKPATRVGSAAWAEQVSLKLMNSSRSATFKQNTSPWLLPIFAAIDDNDNSRVIVRAPTGGGKTTIYDVAIPYIVKEDPGPLQLTFQNDDEAGEYAEERLMPTLEQCEALEGLYPKDKSKARKTAIMFPHMAMRIAGANLGSLQSKSLRWVFGDEVWAWKAGMLAQYEKRTHDRWNSRIVLCSQGSFEGSEFSIAYDDTEDNKWCWVCPECGLTQVYDFALLKYDKVTFEGGGIDFDATGETARVECANVQHKSCDFTFSDSTIVRRELSDGGLYVPTREGRKGHRGFHFNALGVYWIPLSTLVTEWMKAAYERKKIGPISAKMQAFVMKRKAEDYSLDASDDRPELKLSGYNKAQVATSTKFEGELARFLTVDTQQNHFWAIVRAWFPGGASKLLFEGRLNDDSDIEDTRIQYGVQPSLTFIDAQYDTPTVYRLCSKYGWIAFHGDKPRTYSHGVGKRRVQKLYSKMSKASVGAGRKALYLFFSGDKVKDILVGFRNGLGPGWELPNDISKQYAHQIDSETKTEVANKRGYIEKVWVKTKRDNHLWDCEVMQIVGALIFGIIEVDSVESADDRPSDD